VFDRIGIVIVVLIQAVPAAIYHLVVQIYGTEALGKVIYLPTLFQVDNYSTWILPVISLSLFNFSFYALWLRRYMVDESNKDYILLARAKGVPSGRISRSHIFRNAIVPLVQYLPSSILFTLMGSLYVESLYSIPGMGGLLVDVIKRQDNTMVQALVLLYTGLSIAGLLIGDVVMALIDPRITLGAKRERR
jgi:ABC-type dipeptide/oligopeptide/nickel transport system permease component